MKWARRLSQRPGYNKRKINTERSRKSKLYDLQDIANQSLLGSSLSGHFLAEPAQLYYGRGHLKYPQFKGGNLKYPSITQSPYSGQENSKGTQMSCPFLSSIFSSKTSLFPRWLLSGMPTSLVETIYTLHDITASSFSC